MTPRDRGLINSGGPGQRPRSLGIKAPPPPPPPSALYNSLQIQELRHAVYANVWLINMTTLVSECMRYRNLTNEWAQLQADVANYDRKIKYTLGELSKVGEKLALETYLQQGDQILGFAQRDFTTMKPGEAAQVLNTWINNWRAGPALEQVNVSRGDKKLTLYLEFPEDTKELLTLARYPALQLAGDPGTGIVAEQVPIPADVLKNVNGGFDALPSGYRGYLIPADRKRLEDLSLNKKGSSDDVEWLKARILGEALPSFQREADMIRSKVLELEPKLKESVASDVIYRKNGTKVEGQIAEETETYIKIKTRFGAVPIPKEEIAKVELGKGSATEFPPRFAAAKGDLVKLTSLLAWCAEKNLKLEKVYVGYVILSLDASSEKARAAVGLGRPSIAPGLPVEPINGGMIAYEGKNWNAKELKEKLLKDGNTILDGRWFSKKERMITVPGLFNYERQKDKPVTFGGTPLCHDLDITYKTVLDVASNSFVEQPEAKFLKRFYAPEMKVILAIRPPPGIIPPVSTYDLDVRLNCDEGIPPQGTPMKAEVTINVPVGAPILEASVITTAEVKAGGSIVVYLVTGSGENEKRTKLYMCDPKESQSHVIPPELIRGLTEVNLVAVIEETANYTVKVDRRHVRGAVRQGKVVTVPGLDVVHHRLIPDYKAVLFPSTSNTIEVFRLRVSMADSSPMLDKLFSGNPEILK